MGVAVYDSDDMSGCVYVCVKQTKHETRIFVDRDQGQTNSSHGQKYLRFQTYINRKKPNPNSLETRDFAASGFLFDLFAWAVHR